MATLSIASTLRRARGGERRKQTFFILPGEAIEPIVEVAHIRGHGSVDGRTVVLLVDEVVPGLRGHG